MSYAKAAAKNSHQSAEDVERSENNSPSNLVDVDSEKVNTVPADFDEQKIKTQTQAARIELEKEQKELKKKFEEGKEMAKETAKDAKEKARETAKEAQETARDVGNKAQRTAADGYDKFERNKSNPVVMTNMVLLSVAGAGLAYGAYHKHLRGGLTWETVAAWTGGIGVLGLFDYYVSKWFFQNKYPTR